MYLPAHFSEPRTEVLHALMRARPLATLVTLAAGGLDANHIPLRLSPEDGPLGTLRGHVARANPLWRECASGTDALAIFHGPDAYITPGWYPTKAQTGKAVPTWNYAVVHAHGALRAVDDRVWLRAHLAALTAQHEAASAQPWQIEDAPADYLEKMIGAVVGIEIAITRLTGKWKASQNQVPENQAGVAHGLRERAGADDLAMAALVEEAARGRVAR
ncbi:FMN-binding negative transcriptional regulator [Extensimonas sp. H3M7-6]|uniref:FMN-binding negative transcriptional regulator n=1 Tax=Extensimonas soli TaxID=3031322 RepID=UPI0023DC09B7|nr:FMN-binding negative transcriptional regulator [Extensimonas sp. H3M7-6]MDF1481389.1 FMN-binding negative transcriptional regulator [Extensimonas sp. H3M7-6]